MIDTNELRRLAQAATPGPWKAGQYLGSLRQFVIHTDVGDKGRGSDVAFTSAAFGNDETVANARIIAAANPAAVSELLDRLEAAEKERDNANVAAAGVALHAGAMQARLEMVEKERDELRARIEEMSQQKPAKYEFQGRDGKRYPFIDERHYETTLADGSWPIRPLFTLPGTKGEEE